MSDPWHFEKVTLRSGLNMRIARAGRSANPLMVMLHGFPECWYSWRHQLRAFADRFDCVAPEMRGYGETDAPRGVANYTIEKLVGDLADLIGALGRSRAIVVGHDWGGAVAWSAAMTRPEVVDRLIVMNCPHPARLNHELRRNPRQLLRSWYVFFFQLPYLPELMLRAGDFAAVERAMRRSSVQGDAFADADMRYFREAFRNPYSITAAINYYRALIRGSLRRPAEAEDWLRRKIDTPSMLIWGEQDFALGKELTYHMEDLFTGPFSMKYIADSGHWVQQEKPELVNRYIDEFLRAEGR